MSRPQLDRVRPAMCVRCGQPTDSLLRLLGKRWTSKQRVEHRVHVHSLMVLCDDQLRRPPVPRAERVERVQLKLPLTSVRR